MRSTQRDSNPLLHHGKVACWPLTPWVRGTWTQKVSLGDRRVPSPYLRSMASRAGWLVCAGNVEGESLHGKQVRPPTQTKQDRPKPLRKATQPAKPSRSVGLALSPRVSQMYLGERVRR